MPIIPPIVARLDVEVSGPKPSPWRCSARLRSSCTHAGTDPDAPGLEVDVGDPVHVPGRVEHDALPGGLAGEARAGPARDDGDLEARDRRDGGRDVVGIARERDEQRGARVHARVAGEQMARVRVGAHLSPQHPAEMGRELGGARIRLGVLHTDGQRAPPQRFAYPPTGMSYRADAGMSEVLLERRGPAAWVTFNRPQAHNAMTFAMYEALFAHCEEVDADDELRVLVLRGAGGKAFVAGTDIAQFRDFDESGADGLAYEATIDRIVGRLETVRKPTVALVDGFAMGSGLALSAACDLRVCTPAATFGLPIARTVGNCLSMENYARLAGLLGPARLKDIVFTARSIGAEEALAIGLATELVDPGHAEQRVTELCDQLAAHAPVTLRVTKEALRRLRAAGMPDGDDLVREAYASDGFRRHVAAFLAADRRGRSHPGGER